MAISKFSASALLIFLQCCMICFLQVICGHPPYKAIFQFGDSLSDTGNYMSIGAPSFSVMQSLPYGQTYFGVPNGRSSDGRLMVDFIAEAYGLPFLPPYLNRTDIRELVQGANFAVVGATGADVSFFEARNLSMILWSTSSLSVQVQWFRDFKAALCPLLQDCDEYLSKSLFLVGEVGGNDYNFPLLSHRSELDEVLTFVPSVVETIASNVAALIEEGARELVVPGYVAMGCTPAFLSNVYGAPEEDYDPSTGCYLPFNNLSQYHNSLLQTFLETLRQQYPQAKIIYADYYGSTHRFAENPTLFGFLEGNMAACFGGGGLFNYNRSILCTQPGYTVCSNPSEYYSWDGLHLTEAAYRHVASSFLDGQFTSPSMKAPLNLVGHAASK